MLGAYVHGLAGDLAAKKFGEVVLIATDVLDCLPQAFLKLAAGKPNRARKASGPLKRKSIMKTRAVRLYGKDDLRLEEFELPPIRDDEILARVVSDSICMSSHKAAKQGADHKRVPKDIARNPTIIGHEFCGTILEVGEKWQDRFKAGSKFAIQPALNYQGSLDAPGYSYRYIGGDATYVIIPREVMECNCLLDYAGEAFFPASLSEPMSCIIGAFHAAYHSRPGTYVHEMGIVARRERWRSSPAPGRWDSARWTTRSMAAAGRRCWW